MNEHRLSRYMDASLARHRRSFQQGMVVPSASSMVGTSGGQERFSYQWSGASALPRSLGTESYMRCKTAAMPIGNSEIDYELVRKAAGETVLFNDGLFHMVYAGTMWPQCIPSAEAVR